MATKDEHTPDRKKRPVGIFERQPAGPVDLDRLEAEMEEDTNRCLLAALDRAIARRRHAPTPNPHNHDAPELPVSDAEGGRMQTD